MPTRIPLPRHTPPSMTDRLNAHAPEVCMVAAFWTYVGLVALIVGAPDILPHVRPWHAVALVILLACGGLLVGAAIIWPGADSTSWTLETTGYALGGWAWGANTIAETDPFFSALGAAFVVLALWRVIYRVVQRQAYHRRYDHARLRARLRE